MFRALFLAALALSAASVATAQPHRVIRPDRTIVTGVYAPTTVASTITCGERLSYTISVTDGSCSQFANPGSQGEAMPPDYARCANSRGDSAVASCFRGCGPVTGAGRCVTIRDHR